MKSSDTLKDQIDHSWLWCVLSPSDSHQLTLDLNTAHKRLRLSERNRVITYTNTEQPYPDHLDRFDILWQVLCRESVCGRCYWEIEWSGVMFGVFISVSYKSISRKGRGNECWFGYNDQSWSLRCSSSSYSFIHNKIETKLPVKPIISSRIGVYVDHSAGTLSFYSVSGDTMSLIHTVQTTFTQPLYPGFYVGYTGSSVKLCWWIRIDCREILPIMLWVHDKSVTVRCCRVSYFLFITWQFFSIDLTFLQSNVTALKTVNTVI